MFTGAIDMYPRRAKQKLTNIRWEAIFEGIQQTGWNWVEVSDVTGIPQKNISMMSTGRIDVPKEFNQDIALIDLYLMVTHEANLPKV